MKTAVTRPKDLGGALEFLENFDDHTDAQVLDFFHHHINNYDAYIRAQVIDRAGYHLLCLDPALVEDRLKECLLDEDDFVRVMAIEVMADVDAKRYLNLAINMLTHDTSTMVRAEAAHLIGEVGDTLYTPLLLAALNNDEDIVRVRIFWALHKLGDEQALKHLSLLIDSEDYQVRCAVASHFAALPLPAPDFVVSALKNRLNVEDAKNDRASHSSIVNAIAALAQRLN